MGVSYWRQSYVAGIAGSLCTEKRNIGKWWLIVSENHRISVHECVCAGGRIAPSLHLTQQVAGIHWALGSQSQFCVLSASRARLVCKALGTLLPKSALATPAVSIPLVGVFPGCLPTAAPRSQQTPALLSSRLNTFLQFFGLFILHTFPGGGAIESFLVLSLSREARKVPQRSPEQLCGLHVRGEREGMRDGRER